MFRWPFNKEGIKYFYHACKRIFKREDIIYTGLPRLQYSDPCEKMLYGVMNLVCDFVDSGEYDRIVWDEDKNHLNASKNILKVYMWWKFDRPDEDHIVDEWYEGKISLYESVNLQNQIYDKDQEMLHCAVEARPALWF